MAVFRNGSHLTPGQAARILGVSPKTVTRWANEGRIACLVTLGGHRRFGVDAIEAIAVSMGIEDGWEPDAPPERPPLEPRRYASGG